MTLKWAGDQRGYVVLCDTPACPALSEHNSSSLPEAFTAAHLAGWNIRSNIGHDGHDDCPNHR